EPPELGSLVLPEREDLTEAPFDQGGQALLRIDRPVRLQADVDRAAASGARLERQLAPGARLLGPEPTNIGEAPLRPVVRPHAEHGRRFLAAAEGCRRRRRPDRQEQTGHETENADALPGT